VSAVDLQRDAAEIDGMLAQRARVDVNAFATYVMRDEETGMPIEQAPHHVAWHQLAEEHDRLVIWAHVEGGKTTQLSVMRTIWELGIDPSLRFAIVSRTWPMARKIADPVARYIERSSELRRVFPNLRPSKHEQWSPLTGAFTVERPIIAKDPSVQICGINSDIIGARLDRIILDDTVGIDDVRNEDLRNKQWEWIHANLMGRLTARGRVLYVGTAWHRDDSLHRFARLGWPAYVYPVLDPATGLPRWGEHWTSERLEKKRRETTPVEYARQMLCVVSDDSSNRYKWEWIERALKRGEGKPTYQKVALPSPEHRTITGVDLAVQKHSAADLTAFFTILVHPNGDRQLLNIESGRWHGPEILDRIFDHWQRYGSTFVIENVAAQEYISQFVRSLSAIPVVPFTTGRGEASLGVQADELAVELRNGKWIIPNRGGAMEPEVQAFTQNFLEFDPRNHCGDRLAAGLFARHGANLGAQRVTVRGGNLLRR
jgi:hypothetical protein